MHETCELFGNVWPQVVKRHGCIGQRGQKRRGGILGSERETSSEHLVRNHSNGPDVYAGVNLRAPPIILEILFGD